ncbi:MAG: ABC transporter ATP-binding protein [Actinomycetota bacterium]|nr:ABC transporter ATP-binding protein [Actinomycetota bacterium]MDQ6946351.1 ABC transporter ATP-binding protein [Actinomycetota bacterium]
MSGWPIKLCRATRHYRGAAGPVKAVDGVDLEIAQEECVAVMGPSGSGKSTLLALLGGLEVASSGTVEVLGLDWASHSEERRARFRREHLGFVFQNPDLLPFLTAAENVAFAIGVSGAKDPMDPRVALARLGLEAKADRLAGELSGGEGGRVAIARCLAHRPQLVLGDEPTGSLDAVSSARTIEFLLGVVRGIGATAVVVTHDPTVAERFDRTVVLRDGRVSTGERADPGGGAGC